MTKIIQTFWTNQRVQADLLLHNRGGWLSAEYHWMSWALSCLQLRQYYHEVELYTDEAGKHILVDVLGLPYTKVSTALESHLYPPELWALSKIFTYSLQREPFLHVDGDIFIWERFPNRIEKAALVAQNLEIDFPYYYQTLGEVREHFTYIPACMRAEMDKTPIYSSNTGIIGGNDLTLFQDYYKQSLQLIHQNWEQLEKIDKRTFNIGFEQFLYYCLAKEKEIELTCLIDRPEDFDPTYKGFARFECVPYQTKFIHALGDFKRTPETCHHLARRLRQDYPEYYEQIIEVCQSSGVSLDWKYYESMPVEWQYFYEKDKQVYRSVEQLFSRPIEGILATQLVFDKDCRIEETQEPVLKQTLVVPSIELLTTKRTELDSLNMVLLDTFQEPATIDEAIQQAGSYFPSYEVEDNKLVFQTLIFDRIKELMYTGALNVG